LDKKKKKQEKREQLLRQSRFQSINPPDISGRTIVVEKPKYKDPESFDGTKSKFEGWYGAVTDRISTMEESFSTEKQKILWTACLLKGKARDWYESRRRRLRTEGVYSQDTWKMLVRDLKHRFKDPSRQVTAMRKIQTLKYNDSIDEYLDDLQDCLNDVDLSSQELIWKMRAQVPVRIWEKIPNENHIKEAEEYMALLRDAGTQVEAVDFNKKLAKSHMEGYQNKGQEKTKPTPKVQGGGGGQKSGNQGQPSGGNSQSTKPATTTKSQGKKKPEGKGGAVGLEGINKGKTWKEAHSGIDQMEVDSRKSYPACTCCGEPAAEGNQYPHSWKKCPGPKRSQNGPYKKKAAAAAKGNNKKRKRDDEDDSPAGGNSGSKQSKPSASNKRADTRNDSPDNDGEYYRPPPRNCSSAKQASTAPTAFRPDFEGLYGPNTQSEPGRKRAYFFTHGRKGVKNPHLWRQVDGWKTIEARLIEKGADEGIADIPEGYQLATLDQSDLDSLRVENLADFP
jgi:two-component sensor histidine kinase